MLYTSHKKEVWWPIVKEFEERTGIWVTVSEAGTSEILTKIAEARGNPEADVIFGGGAETLEAFRDYFVPYCAAGREEVKPVFSGGRDILWTPFSALPLVMVYNTKLVEPDKVQAWADIMRPEFKGKIAFADPVKSGSGFTALVTLCKVLEQENSTAEENRILKMLSAQLAGKATESSGEVLESVAEGSALIGITLEETALKRIAAGGNLALVYPEEGTSVVPDGSALLRGAPHPENAKRFLDFTLEADVQQLIEERLFRRSVLRSGTAQKTEALPPLERLHPIGYDIPDISRKRDALLMSWEFYFGSGEEREGEP